MGSHVYRYGLLWAAWEDLPSQAPVGCMGGPTITGSESIQIGIILEFKLLVAGSRQIALWFSTNFCPVLL